MAKAWLVSKVVDMANGARVSMIVRACESEPLANEFVRKCQVEMGTLLGAVLVVQGSPRPLGPGSLVGQALGIAGVQFAVVEVELHGAIEVVAPPARIVVPS